MERDKKRVIISTIIAVTLLIALVVGATFAYFGAGDSASGTTNLTTATEKIGTVTITNPTDNLYLKLSAYDMQESKVGTSYYATSTNGTGESVYSLEKENNVFANYTIIGGEEDTIYNCTFKLNITAPSEIRSGDMLLELNLQNGATINGLSTFNKDLYGATGRYTVTFTQTGNGSGNLITGDIKLNNTSGNQSHIAGVTLGTSIQASELNCEIAEKIEKPEEESICTYDETSTVAAGEYGAKYNCIVDPNKPEYTFYLLDNNEDGTSDLIMNANINASGEAVIPGVTEDTGMIEWLSNERYYSLGGPDLSNEEACQYGGVCASNLYGPVTAMEYLYNATKNWSNVEPLNFEYYDREAQKVITTDEGYQSFISTNGIATIIAGDVLGTQVTIGTTQEPLRVRMPISSYDESNEVSDKTDTNAFLYDNMSSSSSLKYWALSSIPGDYMNAWAAYSSGIFAFSKVANASEVGVRPVITVTL